MYLALSKVIPASASEAFGEARVNEMRKIALHGGHSIYELGPVSDVVLFFNCLFNCVVQIYPEQDWTLLTDRLYRRYLRLDELGKAVYLISRVRQIFSQVSSEKGVEWNPSMVGNAEKTWLDPGKSTLADVFGKYFESFENACGSAKSFSSAFDIYKPVRIVISDLAGFMRDSSRPLADYDGLDGDPFWLH